VNETKRKVDDEKKLQFRKEEEEENFVIQFNVCYKHEKKFEFLSSY
jgi:hypothetical protein